MRSYSGDAEHLWEGKTCCHFFLLSGSWIGGSRQAAILRCILYQFALKTVNSALSDFM